MGLNIGFIIFLTIHILTLPGPRHERALKTSVKALKFAQVDKSTSERVIKEVIDLNARIKKLHQEIHRKRLEALKEYTLKKRDIKKIEKIRKDLARLTNIKDKTFAGHMKKLDGILKDKSSEFFSSIYKDVEARINRNK